MRLRPYTPQYILNSSLSELREYQDKKAHTEHVKILAKEQAKDNRTFLIVVVVYCLIVAICAYL